jgi:mRNA interferase MazF
MTFDQGDIIEMNFDPSIGHEPKHSRPALVVSNNEFNADTSMTIVCPITRTDNGFYLHEPVPAGHEVHGFVVMEQLRAVDLTTRQTEYIDHLSTQEMQPILVCVNSFFDV